MKKYLDAKSICEPIIARYQHIEINDSKMADRLARHYDTLGRIDFIEENFEQAEELYRKAKELRQVGGNIALLAHSDGNLAGVAAMRGDWAGSALAFESVEALWKTLGDVRMSTIGALNFSECMIELAERAENDEGRAEYLSKARQRLARVQEPLDRLGSKDLEDSRDELLKRLGDA
jgi:tetratricopeptide (TPR) repeat protein